MNTNKINIFQYGIKEIDYLKSKDKKLSEIIDQIGMIEREIIPDLFPALISSIVGQQISVKAWDTVWLRLNNKVGKVTPKNIDLATIDDIQSCGMTIRKAHYIKEAAIKVLSGDLDLDRLYLLSDEDVCKSLSKLNGIGVWTAEMLMIFSMGRMDILSYGDLAIHRGLRMLYHHRSINKKMFTKYKNRFSPYGSVAALYLWAIAGGALGLKDYAPKKK